MWRFLQHVWRLLAAQSGCAADGPGAKDAAAWAATQKTLARVEGELTSRNHFNIAIAAPMELYNTLYALGLHEARAGEVGGATGRRVLQVFPQLLAPFAPHLAEEIWHALGGAGLCALAADARRGGGLTARLGVPHGVAQRLERRAAR